MSHLNAFHLFSQLPTELRLRIWYFSLPAPRIVEVRCGSDSISDSSSPPQSPSTGTAGCVSWAKIPVVLSVCRESRTEALRHYKPLFGFAGRPGRVYVDPECDVLYFGACPGAGLMGAFAQFQTVLALCEPEELAGVRRVAIDEAVLGPLTVFAHNTFSGNTGEDEQFIVRAGRVEDILKLVASHLPGLRELVIASDTAKRRFSSRYTLVQSFPDPERFRKKTLQGAVEVALLKVSRALPHWVPPVCEVVARDVVS